MEDTVTEGGGVGTETQSGSFREEQRGRPKNNNMEG